MKIAINLLYLLPGIVGGTETYARGLLGGLASVDKNNEYFIFVNRESASWPLPDAANFTRVVCPVRASSQLTRYVFEQTGLPLLLKKYGADVVHSLGYVGPLWAPCRKIVTIHDMNTVGHKNMIPLIKRIFLGMFVKYSALTADHVITVSEFSRSEIMKYVKISPERISVTHEASNSVNKTFEAKDTQAVQQMYAIDGPYLLAFGGVTHNKNIPNLIKAFSKISPAIKHSLVLIGHLPPKTIIHGLIDELNLGGRVIMTGYVPDNHVHHLLKGSELFVFPSLYEGFGLPILEAQKNGVCVACSRRASLPEVAAAGAQYFDPESIEDMASVIAQCLNSDGLRKDLIAKGYENSEKYSWEKTATETLRLYHLVLQGK